jgi:hypothetical protein
MLPRFMSRTKSWPDSSYSRFSIRGCKGSTCVFIRESQMTNCFIERLIAGHGQAAGLESADPDFLENTDDIGFIESPEYNRRMGSDSCNPRSERKLVNRIHGTNFSCIVFPCRPGYPSPRLCEEPFSPLAEALVQFFQFIFL